MRILLLGLLAGAVYAQTPPPRAVGPDKKLIEWGWDEPSPSFMRANQAKMDALGFDGVIFHLDAGGGKPADFCWQCWGKTQYELADFADSLADLQACSFQRLTDNFARFNVCPGEVDWFDDAAFAIVAHNAEVAATVAKQGGCKGLMFDIEQYNSNLFSYAELPGHEAHTFAEVEAEVRQRGRELMQAFNRGYPDITVLLTFGYSITGVGGDRSKARYGLLKNLLDGMFEAAAPDSTIVDAYEGAYPFRHHSQFVGARKAVLEQMADYSGAPEAYRQHIRVGFGVWMDMDWRRYGWHTDDFTANYFTPDEFEYTLHAALTETDRYVWIYTETPRWWTDDKLPAEYLAALRRAKEPHLLDDAQHPAHAIAGDPGPPKPVAARQAGYSDQDTFGDLEAEWRFVADLPKTWRFRTDPKDEGVGAGWFKPGADQDGWKDLEIGKFWDEQGLEYTGFAWYTLDWEPPQVDVPAGHKLVLWFGAVDETAEVWVNGELCGKHDDPPDIGWDKRFPIDVTGRLKPGAHNLIAVRVNNASLAGGIWKSVKLAISR